MTLQSDLESAIANARAAADLLKAIVNGPAAGEASLVEVESGTVKTLSRALAEVGDTSLLALKDLTNVVDAAFAAKADAAGVGGDMKAGENLADLVDPEEALGNLGGLSAAEVMALIAAAGGGGSTGDIKATLFSSAASGWLMLNQDTIGNAASGADQASDDYEALFTGLWDGLDDTAAPVVGGRGASAAEDWAAGKMLTLPDGKRRTLIGADPGGTPARILGETGGAEEAVVVDHSHGVSGATVGAGGGHSHSYTARNSFSVSGGTEAGAGSAAGSSTGSAGSHSHSLSGNTDSAGADGGDANMPPWLAVNWMIKF